MPDAAYVAFDLETTGLSPRSDRVIEIGATRLDAELSVVGELEVLVDPGVPVPLVIQRLTGIGDADLAGAPTPVEGMAQLAEFCEGADLVAHGSAFDVAFCSALLPSAFAGRDVFDTLELARILLPLAPSHSLPVLSKHLDIPHERPHRACSDASATAALFRLLVEEAEGLPADVLAQLRAMTARAPRALAGFFAGVVRGGGDASVVYAPGAPRHVSAPAVMAPAGATQGVAGDGAPLGEAAAGVLGPRGAFAGDPRFELRETQVEMARAVGQTLDRGGRLLVEAGTGTGKSLAYLTPLALWAARGGGRAVVATHTITLQEQIAHRDLPALAGALDAPVSFALLKGRQHYLSLRRWQRMLAAAGGDGDLETLRFALKVLVWLGQSERGDRAELRLSGAEEAQWRRVRSDARDCLGPGCANWHDARCFMVAARRAAADADVVVTNHALVLADGERQGQVLAPYSALVVDEAHHLETSATHQFSSALRPDDVLSALDRIRSLLPAAGAEDLDTALTQCRDAVLRMFGEAKGFTAEVLALDQPSNALLGLSGPARDHARWAQLERAARHLVRALGDTRSALLAARGSHRVQTALLPQPSRADEELELAADTLQDAAAAVERITGPPREGNVTWIALRAEQAELHEAPVEVAGRLRRQLFDRVEAAVLTSATLSVGGSFDFVRDRIGIGGAHELRLASPFDFLSQALCIVPSDLPPYDDEAYDSALADLVADVARRLGGRTLVLFTGYGPLRRAHALLGPRFAGHGLAVLGQGLDGTRRQVLASYLADTRAVLLGTSSFWEGIDLPGDALSCVIIAKLPFPVPTDPLVQARAAGLQDPFRELALPVAVLRLQQGFGRLIRHGNDRGAVVLCDSRISSREYGATFLAALPQAAVAREPRKSVAAVVADFVRDGRVPTHAAPVASGRAEEEAWWDEEPA